MEQEKELTYDEFINNILETRGRFACGDEYHETHHIVPKCLGGTDEEDNLIDLFAREHFEAHRLLALEHPDVQGLTYAWWCMSVQTNQYTNERYRLTPQEYEEARIAVVNLQLGKHLSEDIKKKLSEINKGENNPFYGQTHNEEAKQKMRNKNVSNATREKMSQSAKQRCDDKWRMEASKRAKQQCLGKNNPNSKKVIQYDMDGTLIKIWDYVKQAADALNINKTCISGCCCGRQKSAGGFVWCYVDEEIKQNKEKTNESIQSNMSEDKQN